MRATPLSMTLAALGLVLALLLAAETAQGQAPRRMTARDLDGLRQASHVVLAPPSYAALWDSLAVACGCTPATTLEALTWHIAAKDGFACGAGQCIGLWANTGDIFLAGRYSADRRLVAHEMLHAILGTGVHTPLFSRLNLGGDN